MGNAIFVYAVGLLMIDVDAEMDSLIDRKYAEFSAELNPGIDRRILGIRLPELRKLGKRIASDDWGSYLADWEYRHYEDSMLRGFVISYVKIDLDSRLKLFSDFIPYIDSWSVCDSFASTWKPRQKEAESFWNFIVPYLDTGKEFEMRYSAVAMMDHFIDGEHIDEILELMDSHDNEGYYYRMAAAWNLATCLAKFPDKTFAYLASENSLPDFTFNKTIQKSIESFRISDEMKGKLRQMRR